MQPVENTTYDNAFQLGYDCIQHKYKGQWVRIVISKGLARFYDTANVYIEDREVDPLVDITLIGNWWNGHLYTFDCWFVNGNKTTHFSYRDRYSLTYVSTAEVKRDWCSVVRNFPISDARTAWSQIIPNLHCGLVFRKTKDDIGGVVLCQRWYENAPAELA